MMPSSRAVVTVLLTMRALRDVIGAGPSGDGGWLSGPQTRHRAVTIEAKHRDDEFNAAMGEVMGCGGGMPPERFTAITRALTPSWRALPKNRYGRVEWGMLRYLSHRYFMQQSSFLIRGFEPTRQINASSIGTADILSNHPSAAIEEVLTGKHRTQGFSLDDAVMLVASLEQLILDSQGVVLDLAYAAVGKDPKHVLNSRDMFKVIEAYTAHWMTSGVQQEYEDFIVGNRTLLAGIYHQWPEVSEFVDGVVKRVEFAMQHSVSPGRAGAALSGEYTYKEVHDAVHGFSRTFASFWETECQDMKSSLVAMDHDATGRVPLAQFYGANLDGNWRFGESEAYLRELGALDETSAWRGKQVIIPNYVQGVSNCIVTTQHYLVCCVPECEEIMNDVEDAVGGPLATPTTILHLVGNMSNFEDDHPVIGEELTSQLENIAHTYGGMVPLHGRRFGQWLHYVFPRECPFPHKVGAVSATTPSEFGHSLASEEELAIIAKDVHKMTATAARVHGLEDAQNWMTQWDDEEAELLGDYSTQLTAPWRDHVRLTTAASALVVLMLLWLGILRMTQPSHRTFVLLNSALGQSEKKLAIV